MACACAALEEQYPHPEQWWPNAKPADVTLTTLPAAGSTTSPLRLPFGEGEYVGVWGYFQGLRLAVGSTEDYPVLPGTVVRLPRARATDIFMSADVGAGGVATFGRFLSRAAAEAFMGISLGRAGVNAASGGPTSSISLGSFTPAIAGTVLVDNSAGASDLSIAVAGDGNNAAAVFVAETQAKAALLGAAGGGIPVYASGILTWLVPAGAKLFGASAAGTMICYVEQSS